MKTPVIIRGINFPSKSAAARHYGISTKAMQTRLNKGWTLEQALDLDPPDSHKSYNLWLRRIGKEERVCSLCKIQKPLSAYYQKPNSASGTHGSQCRECTRKTVLKNFRKREYGLDKKTWSDLFISQDSCCAICGITESNDRNGEWHTDHCHKTDIVRGILCKNCNCLLGFAKDNIKTLEKAIEYLK